VGGLDREILEIGTQLSGAFPKRGMNPMRALDDKAMELASRDAELRTALFRLVDVTPATRSLDDLARHLTGFLSELQSAPPPIAVLLTPTTPKRTTDISLSRRASEISEESAGCTIAPETAAFCSGICKPMCASQAPKNGLYSPHGNDHDLHRALLRRHSRRPRRLADQRPNLRDALHRLAVGRR